MGTVFWESHKIIKKPQAKNSSYLYDPLEPLVKMNIRMEDMWQIAAF
jgi:hypothetical protein